MEYIYKTYKTVRMSHIKKAGKLKGFYCIRYV